MIGFRTSASRPSKPSTPPQPIFCDESGMTGNDLLDVNQAYFTYAGVAISFERAEDIVHRLLRDHRLQGNELKGRQLVRTSRGQRAITSLLQEISQEIHLIMHHKKYALACKFFEYIFEPVLSDQNSIFYEAGFHKFISNMLYLWASVRPESTEQLLTDFAEYMRSLDPKRVPSFFGEQRLICSAGSDPLSDIGTFCLIHREKIAEELNSLIGTRTGKWILDLTSGSLFSILSYWGDRFHQLDVYCDDAKPLQKIELFESMVNRSERIYQQWGDKERLFTFNLTRSPQLVCSEQFYGVQIADVCASSLRHALENPDSPEAQEWMEFLTPRISDESVWYDFDNLDLETPEAFINGMLLRELVDRSLRKESLFDNIPEFIAAAEACYQEFRSRQNKG